MADLSTYLKNEFGVVMGEYILAHLLWADDLILISDSLHGIRMQLKGLAKFCSNNQMLVNELKTKIMCFGRPENIKLEFNGKLIEQVSEYKYLGCIIKSIQRANADPLALNYKYICDLARKAIYGMRKKISNVGTLKPNTMMYLFNAAIRPSSKKFK